MAEQEGYLEFIESFNHIHKYLKKFTHSDDNVSFSDLLSKAKSHPMIHQYLDELHLFRKLRNIIIHQTDDFEQLIARPSDEVVERIKFIEKQLVDPATVGVFKAEVIKLDDYKQFKSEAACRDNGKIAIEGKEYVVQDGDIMHFRFNV